MGSEELGSQCFVLEEVGMVDVWVYGTVRCDQSLAREARRSEVVDESDFENDGGESSEIVEEFGDGDMNAKCQLGACVGKPQRVSIMQELLAVKERGIRRHSTSFVYNTCCT